MINCSFLPVFYEYHQNIKAGKPGNGPDNFKTVENIWMGFYGLGLFETYRFMYEQCTSTAHLQEWLITLKGEKQVTESAAAFEEWMHQKTGDSLPEYILLNEEQLQSWNQLGYIRVSGLVSEHLCDAVSNLICTRLGAVLNQPDTWYNNHPDWHGLMLQLYQHESINAIKTLPGIKQLFAELYGTTRLIANTEKVSFNPPETDLWKFRHNQLHWDIDFNKPNLYYIQGLVYLNEVPENRGPLNVVPGFQHRFEDWMHTYSDAHAAIAMVRSNFTGTPVPGNKGDVILWQQTLPHAASANYSNLPRFVQYISFTRL